MHPTRLTLSIVLAFILCVLPSFAQEFRPAPGKKIKLFILSGQSNMVGQGEEKMLPQELREGNGRVLMFEGGKWQPLKPIGTHKKYDSPTFGPEIAFAHQLAKAYPDQTIGIVKQSVGGTGILAWSPTWTKEQADRTKDGKKGNLWKALTDKVHAATQAAPCEIAGFLWVQGGKDMQFDTGLEYLDNLSILVNAMRKKTGERFLPFLLSSYRNDGLPDDLSADKELKIQISAKRPFAYHVLQAQYDIQKVSPPARMVPLHNLAAQKDGIHYNTKGQLELGKIMAEAYLDMTGG